MRRRRAIAVILAAIAAACVAAIAASCVATPTSRPSPPSQAEVVFDTGRGTTHVRVEVADTADLRQRGLMGRSALAAGSGMLFVFDEDSRAAFHMRDTLIPLSIAFLAADGTVLRILDMEPCTLPICPAYSPDLAYRYALEVDRGAFDRWGVAPGDRARIVR